MSSKEILLVRRRRRSRQNIVKMNKDFGPKAGFHLNKGFSYQNAN